jgi:hypothetical protein
MLILATGFRTLEFMYPIKVHGLGGRGMEDIWKGGARAFLGMTVESLPNFAMLYGPNTNLGHNSIILMIEAQSRYINTMIGPVLRARSTGQTLVVIPKTERVQKYNSSIQDRLRLSTFEHPSCHSWYKNADGLVTNNWCGTVVEYQQRTSTLDWEDFDLTGSTSLQLLKQKAEHIGRVVEETQVSTVGLLSAVTGAVIVAVGLTLRTNVLSSLAHGISMIPILAKS